MVIMRSALTEHAQTFCLTFICDGSFQSFTVGDLDYAMTAAFGPKIFHSQHEAHRHVSRGPAPAAATHQIVNWARDER